MRAQNEWPPASLCLHPLHPIHALGSLGSLGSGQALGQIRPTPLSTITIHERTLQLFPKP